MRMIKYIKTVVPLLALLGFNGLALETTTVTATNSDISKQLDLNAVASIFGQSKDLADFEQRLNSPDNKISNLDLNNDGKVDYLRVVENVDRNLHVVTIQDVLGDNYYQDVATIEVEKTSTGVTQVQVVGDTYIYGNDYVVRPAYHYEPVMFTLFWVATYQAFHSPYRWGYYPHYYRPWRPVPAPIYRKNVNIHIDNSNHYTYVHNGDRNRNAINIQEKNRRDDWHQKGGNRNSYNNRPSNSPANNVNRRPNANKSNELKRPDNKPNSLRQDKKSIERMDKNKQHNNSNKLKNNNVGEHNKAGKAEGHNEKKVKNNLDERKKYDNNQK